MRNVNAFIGALAIGSIFALGTGFPYQKLITPFFNEMSNKFNEILTEI